MTYQPPLFPDMPPQPDPPVSADTGRETIPELLRRVARDDYSRPDSSYLETGHELFDAADQVEYLVEQHDMLLETLVDMVHQHAYCPEDGLFDSMALTANAEAMRLLRDYGLFEIEHEKYRRVIGRFKTTETGRFSAAEPVYSNPKENP